MDTKQRGIQKIKLIAQAPNNVFIIHYSCESFTDKDDGYSPRISSIAVKDFDSSQAYSFSIHNTAEIEKISRGEIEKDYDNLEKKMLDKFFVFISKHKSKIFVHWNMRDTTYGFQAIYHRFEVLGGIPVVIEESRLVDLSKVLSNIYGPGYVGHPKMEKLIDLNGITKRHFLTGAEEADAFVKKEYYRLHLSTLRKVDAFSDILQLQIKNSLKTKIHPVVARIKGWHEHWLFQLAELILAVIGLVAATNTLISIFQ
ncbi:hypothetical protein [Candidatus Chloroploca sp. Khr17]|uniref:hypothetical protein n=1 Tax=Candidatus Chloroploca sp. Khr17 TaxID=2496869 RepID=UPI00101D6B35|nr:hypothetical protein [Candidatus Chloroploca sp. Khr17]